MIPGRREKNMTPNNFCKKMWNRGCFSGGFMTIINCSHRLVHLYLYTEGTDMSKKYCYLFTEGNAKMRELLGGKGANLAEMTNIGLPVPQGFTISTEACTQYYEDGRRSIPKSRRRSWSISRRWRRSPARSSAIWKIPCWFPCVPAPALPCPA